MESAECINRLPNRIKRTIIAHRGRGDQWDHKDKIEFDEVSGCVPWLWVGRQHLDRREYVSQKDPLVAEELEIGRNLQTQYLYQQPARLLSCDQRCPSREY
jgi:hypothetical protein